MIKVLSLFSGIGAFEKALQNLNIPFELVAYSEINKYASYAYSVLHNVSEEMNLGDITKVDETKLPTDIDLVTFGFPCQPFSNAGLQEGFEDSKGRGNLFFDALRVIKHCKPKIAIAENVKNLATSDRFKNEFAIILKSLDEAGYNCYHKVLDGVDYSVAQHRERIIIVCIRKDIDNGIFEFPQPVELKKCLYDYLEAEPVDAKYYVNNEKVQSLIPFLKNKLISGTIRGGVPVIEQKTSMGFGSCQQGAIISKCASKISAFTDIAHTILARDYKGFGNQEMNGVIVYRFGKQHKAIQRYKG